MYFIQILIDGLPQSSELFWREKKVMYGFQYLFYKQIGKMHFTFLYNTMSQHLKAPPFVAVKAASLLVHWLIIFRHQ